MSRLFLTLLTLCLCSTTIKSQENVIATSGSDYTCDYLAAKGFYRQRITINSGDKFSYKTQVGKSYPPSKDLLWEYPLPWQTCVVHYELGTCSRLLFKCSSLNLRNRDPMPWRCQEGDKMVVFKHNDGEIFKNTRKHPLRVRSTESLTVRTGLTRKYFSLCLIQVKLVISSRTKGGRGGRNCSVRCLD